MPRSLNHHTQKSETTLTARGNKSSRQIYKMSSTNVSRLAGGADSPETAEELQKSDESDDQEIKSETKIKSEMEIKSDIEITKEPSEGEENMAANREVEDEEVRKFPSLEAVLTGDKKVDDLIAYVQRNLREACEALAGLGDNIEHEIKLMFVDVIARIRKWVNSTENKLEKTMAETINLQIEFKTKLDSLANCENDMEALRIQLEAAESAAKKSKNKKSEDQKSTKGVDETRRDDLEQTRELHREQSSDLTPSARRLRDSGEESGLQDLAGNESGASRASSRIDNRMAREVEHTQSQREIELQKEVECLRKENERLIKERTEYENAVQRAILKGVSSLNVEALKVMRNPPATCYDPCGQSSSIIEPTIPCAARMSDNFHGSNMSNYSESQTVKKSHGKKTCTNANCPSAKNRKRSLAQSLLLLNERHSNC